MTDAEKLEFETLPAAIAAKEAEYRSKVLEEDAAAVAAAADLERGGGEAESRERLEIRSRTGLADFLRAAAGGTSVSGAAAEYASSLGVPTTGHLPMELFARSAPQPEMRAITPGPAVKGALQPIVPYLFERSAAASLGIMMPSVPAGQVQIPKVGTAPPADTLAKDGTAPATAAAVSLVNQGSGQNRRAVRGQGRGPGRHAVP